ncbi:hypothetical protein SRHO_G00088070 [Serrasalmus rhombeus]
MASGPFGSALSRGSADGAVEPRERRGAAAERVLAAGVRLVVGVKLDYSRLSVLGSERHGDGSEEGR